MALHLIVLYSWRDVLTHSLPSDLNYTSIYSKEEANIDKCYLWITQYVSPCAGMADVALTTLGITRGEGRHV